MDNYQLNNCSLLEADSKKIILYDAKNDEVIPYLTSLTFAVTVELANLFFNKSNKIDLERTRSVAGKCRKIKNSGIQKGYFNRQQRLLGYSKLLLNERDSLLLFAALKRIVKLCLVRAEFAEINPQVKPQTPGFEFNEVETEANCDPLDVPTLNKIHENRMSDPHFHRLTNSNFDYSAQLTGLTAASRLFPIIDEVFEALSFIESAGLQIPAIFVMPENQQADVFHSFILSLMFWGSSLPLSTILGSPSSPFDPLLSIRLALVAFILQDKARRNSSSSVHPS